MSYDRLAESLRLIEQGPPAVTPQRLSRRIRFVPLAVDVIGDLAVTMFVRRTVSGCPEVEDHALEHTADGWRMLGGSGGSAPEELLSDRPAAGELGELVRGHGHGSTARSSRASGFGARRPFRHLHYGEYRVASEVASVVVVRSRLLARRRARGSTPLWLPGRGWTVAGSDHRSAIGVAVRSLICGRPIAVPRHGNVIVAWTARRAPRLVALDVDGRPLAVVPADDLWPSGHRPPLSYRVQFRHPWLRRLRPHRRRAVPGWAPLQPPDQTPDDDDGPRPGQL